MNYVNVLLSLRKCSARVSLGLSVAMGVALISSAQQQPTIPIELQDSGKTLTMRADSQSKDKNVFTLLGHVVITYREMKLTAHQATLDELLGEIVATGDVLFVDPHSRLVADEVHFNIHTQEGWFSKCSGSVHSNAPVRRKVLHTDNPFYIQGDEILRLDETTYTVKHGRLTNCDCEREGWSLAANQAKIEVDNKVFAHGTVVRFLGIPIFYLPYSVTSVARMPRQTGFLLPEIGDSSQKGRIFGEGFFWAISPSIDLLLGLEDYNLRGIARRAQFRARPSDTLNFTMDYFGVNDKDAIVANRAPGQSLKAVGNTIDLPLGFRGVADVDYTSSLAFRETYSPTFTEAVNSEAHQTGFVTKAFDAYDFSIYATRYQNFLSTALTPGNSIIIRKLPEFSFSGMDRQVGNSPFYFSFRSSAGAVGRTEPGLYIPSFSERAEMHPEITLRTGEFWGFHVTPSAGVEAAWYGESLDANHQPVTRFMGDFSLDLRPPPLERVFARSLWGRHFKHVIEPDIVYRVVKARQPEDLANIVRYDDLDILSQTNEVEYSLTNTLLTRKTASSGTGDTPQSQELISWRISQKYYMDPTFGGVLGPDKPIVWAPTLSLTGFHFIPGRRLSPVVSDLKFAPFTNYDTELQIDLSPTGGGILDAGVTSHVKHGLYGLAFTDFFVNRNTGLNLTSATTTSTSTTAPIDTSYHLLNLLATYGDVNRKGFSGAFGVDYNLVQKIAAGAVGQVSYNFGCFGVNVEYRRFSLTTLRQENIFRVAISLANIGTFGDYKPRDRLY